LSTCALAAPIDLSSRSDELDLDDMFAREPADQPSRIPRWRGLARAAAALQRPRAPTPNNMRSNTINRPPMSPSPSPPGTPRPIPPSRIPVRVGKRSYDAEDEIYVREPADQPSRIPRWVGLARAAAALQRPRAPTPNNMRSNTINRPPLSPTSRPGTPRPIPPSRIPVRVGKRSYDAEDEMYARDQPSRIPRWVGLARTAAAIQRPRAPTPNNMRSNTINRPPMSPSPSPPGTPRPVRASRIPVRVGRRSFESYEEED